MDDSVLVKQMKEASPFDLHTILHPLLLQREDAVRIFSDFSFDVFPLLLDSCCMVGSEDISQNQYVDLVIATLQESMSPKEVLIMCGEVTGGGFILDSPCDRADTTKPGFVLDTTHDVGTRTLFVLRCLHWAVCSLLLSNAASRDNKLTNRKNNNIIGQALDILKVLLRGATTRIAWTMNDLQSRSESFEEHGHEFLNSSTPFHEGLAADGLNKSCTRTSWKAQDILTYALFTLHSIIFEDQRKPYEVFARDNDAVVQVFSALPRRDACNAAVRCVSPEKKALIVAFLLETLKLCLVHIPLSAECWEFQLNNSIDKALPNGSAAAAGAKERGLGADDVFSSIGFYVCRAVDVLGFCHQHGSAVDTVLNHPFRVRNFLFRHRQSSIMQQRSRLSPDLAVDSISTGARSCAATENQFSWSGKAAHLSQPEVKQYLLNNVSDHNAAKDVVIPWTAVMCDSYFFVDDNMGHLEVSRSKCLLQSIVEEQDLLLDSALEKAVGNDDLATYALQSHNKFDVVTFLPMDHYGDSNEVERYDSIDWDILGVSLFTLFTLFPQHCKFGDNSCGPSAAERSSYPSFPLSNSYKASLSLPSSMALWHHASACAERSDPRLDALRSNCTVLGLLLTTARCAANFQPRVFKASVGAISLTQLLYHRMDVGLSSNVVSSRSDFVYVPAAVCCCRLNGDELNRKLRLCSDVKIIDVQGELQCAMDSETLFVKSLSDNNQILPEFFSAKYPNDGSSTIASSVFGEPLVFWHLQASSIDAMKLLSTILNVLARTSCSMVSATMVAGVNVDDSTISPPKSDQVYLALKLALCFVEPRSLLAVLRTLLVSHTAASINLANQPTLRGVLIDCVKAYCQYEMQIFRETCRRTDENKGETLVFAENPATVQPENTVERILPANISVRWESFLQSDAYLVTCGHRILFDGGGKFDYRFIALLVDWFVVAFIESKLDSVKSGSEALVKDQEHSPTISTLGLLCVICNFVRANLGSSSPRDTSRVSGKPIAFLEKLRKIKIGLREILGCLEGAILTSTSTSMLQFSVESTLNCVETTINNLD